MDWVAVQAIGTWVGAVGAVGALVFFSVQTKSLARQTKSLVASYQFDSQWRRHNKSSELALFYAHSIIPLIDYCSSVLAKADVYPLLKSVDPKCMVRFNRTELEEDLGLDGNIEALVDESLKKISNEVFAIRRTLLPVDARNETAEELLALRNLNERQQELLNIAFRSEFWAATSTLLNDLEYFSMCINSGIADGDVLYPSLHQTFFSMISAFYFLIASHNTSMKDKYYTHIIELFTKWRERFFDHERKERQIEDEMSRRYHRVP